MNAINFLPLLIALHLPQVVAQTTKPASPQVKDPAQNALPQKAPGQIAPNQTPPVLKEIPFDIKGTAYTGPGWKSKAPALAPKELEAELTKLKLKLKLTPVDMSTVYQTQPEFSVSDATAMIIEPYETRVLGRDYAILMGVDPAERCHREVQIVTLKGSGINSLDQLNGKDLAFLDGPESVVYLSKTSNKYKTLLMASSEDQLKTALTTKKVQAFIAPVYRLPKKLISEALGEQELGKTSGDFEVIHVTETQVPCWVIAVKQGAKPETLFRLMENGKTNPQQGKLLMGSVGNFQSMYLLPLEAWPKLRDQLGIQIYSDFKAGKLNLPAKKI